MSTRRRTPTVGDTARCKVCDRKLTRVRSRDSLGQHFWWAHVYSFITDELPVHDGKAKSGTVEWRNRITNES